MSYCEYCHDAATYFCSQISECEGARTSVCKRCAARNKFTCSECGSCMVEEDELVYPS